MRSPRKSTRLARDSRSTPSQVNEEVKTVSSPKKRKQSNRRRKEDQLDDNLVAFKGYEDKKQILMKLINSTVEGVESNSAIIIGPRGCGKSSLVKSSLKDIKNLTSKSHLLKFDGFFHRDESKILDSFKELTESEADNIGDLMVDVKEYCNDRKKALVVILDEFDQFCRKSQLFLYNLFDLSQKCTFICVIGITCRIDCLELLEKRVRSRMNQTLLHIYSPFAKVDEYISHASVLLKRDLTDDETRRFKEAYSVDRTPLCLERDVLQLKLTKSSSLPHSDPLVRRIADLSHQELLILTAAYKFCSTNNVDQMFAKSLFAQVSRIPNRTDISKRLQHTLISNLIQSGFLVRVIQSRQQASEYLNDWTTLQLGFHVSQLRDAIKLSMANIPSYLRAVIHI